MHGLHITQDTGPPEGSTDYTTLVVVHGYVWHSGIFIKMAPLASSFNVRLVLVNRRDYPGSEPYTDEERAALRSLGPNPSANDVVEAKRELALFMMDRARELHGFLEDLIRREDIPPVQPGRGTGGLVITGWSFGTVWPLALLSHVASFSVKDVDLGKYVRRVVAYDPAYHIVGYPPPEGAWNPVHNADLSLTDEERMAVFNVWATGYYNHGTTLETVEMRAPLHDPPPTISVLSPEVLGNLVHTPPGDVGGSDNVLLLSGGRTGLLGDLRRGALFLSSDGEHHGNGDDWSDVELRFVWCKRSTWETTYASWQLSTELKGARESGACVRKVKFVSINEGNHFIHWDKPELILHALVKEEMDDPNDS